MIEAASECGGKMRGRFNPETQQFEEHSIRALSSTYFSLFDVYHRAGILDRLSPVDEYLFYKKADDSRVGIDRTDDLGISTMRQLIQTFDLSVADMLQLGSESCTTSMPPMRNGPNSRVALPVT